MKCYSWEGAYVTREEDFKGSIEPGKVADIVVLPIDITSETFKLHTDDLSTVEKEKRRIKALNAYMTMIDGEIVYMQ